MKKISFLMLIMIVALSVKAQKFNDKIVLINGGTIKCHIIEADTVNGIIKYVANKNDGPKTMSLENVKTYAYNDKEYKSTFAASFPENSSETPLYNKITTTTVYENDGAGQKLITFSSTAQVGLALMFAGTLVTALPSILPTENRDPIKLDERNRQLTTIGLLASSVGFVTFFASFSSARNAGKLLNNPKHASVGVNNDGLTLKIPIKQK